MIMLTLKPKCRINLQQLAIRVSHQEGGKVNLPIAQISEVQSHVLNELAREWKTNPRGVAELLDDRNKRNKPKLGLVCLLAAAVLMVSGCATWPLGPQTVVDPAKASVDRITDDKAIAEDDEVIRIRIVPGSTEPERQPEPEPEVMPLYYIDPGQTPEAVLSDTVTVDLGNGQRVAAPPGATVEIDIQRRNRDPRGAKEVVSSKGQSIGLSTREGGIAGSMEFSAPDVGEDRAAGGDFSFGWRGLSANKGSLTLYIIGGLMVAAGVAAGLLLKDWSLGLMVAGSGVAVIAIGIVFEKYFWIVWLLAAGVAVWFLFRTRAGAKLRQAFLGVIRGVEKAEPEGGPVKQSIKAEDDGTIKSEVSKLKQKMGVHHASQKDPT